MPTFDSVFNPWRDFDPTLDVCANAPAVRSENLRQYLATRTGRTKLLFVAEAPSYRGCRFTGIAMTSERILLGMKRDVAPEAVFEGEKRRTSLPGRFPKGATEPTASIAWPLLLAMGLAHEVAFWNAFPCHPHRPGAPLTNRKPTAAELSAAAHVLPQMIALVRPQRVIAVGRVAEGLMKKLGVPAEEEVRHPANGGATQFRQQVRALVT